MSEFAFKTDPESYRRFVCAALGRIYRGPGRPSLSRHGGRRFRMAPVPHGDWHAIRPGGWIR